MFGCGASDRGLLFTAGSEPSHDPVVEAGGSTGSGGVAQGGSGPLLGLGMQPGQLPSSGGSPIMQPTATSSAPPPPPGSGGGPPIMMVGSGGSAGMGQPPPPPMPAPDAGVVDPSLPPLARCNFAGTWATIIRVPVTWPDAPLVLHGGSGQVVQWNISHRVRDGALTYHEATSLCGIYLPDLSGSVLANNQKFGIRFPNDLFDHNYIPPVVFATTATVVGNDVSWNAGPVSLLTGLLMPDPANTTWPTSFPVAQTPDQDKDGAPGVTVIPVDPATDPTYNWPPVGLPPTLGVDYPRAKRISVVVRTVTNLRGTVASCDEMRSAVDIIDIDGAPALNSMVIGCVKTTGETCTADEASFVNNARPQFTPSGPGTLASVRIADSGGCPDVRSRLPQ